MHVHISEVVSFSACIYRPYLWPQTQLSTSKGTALCSTFSDDDSPLPNNKKLNLSASARERRNEELRRLSRSDDVVIGKTSAKADAKDYALDPARTEAEYRRDCDEDYANPDDLSHDNLDSSWTDANFALAPIRSGTA